MQPLFLNFKAVRTWSIFLLLFLPFFCPDLSGQDSEAVQRNIQNQLSTFPQEKVYIHTDKAAYVSGEKIWYRVYLIDAATHMAKSTQSRYVYVDLTDPVGRTLYRSMIRPDRDSCFHNCMELSGDLPQGEYMLRGYTRYMLNRPDYLFEKKVFISDPHAFAANAQVSFIKSGSRNGRAKVTFRDKDDRPIEVNSFMAGIDTTANLTSYAKDKEVSFRVIPNKKQTLYVVFEYNDYVHRAYFSIPDLEEMFDVTFHPEGGYLLADAENKVGFKAINTNGLSEPVSIEILEKGGKPIAKATSNVLGMGAVVFHVEHGKQYMAVCTNAQNVSKQVSLPAARSDVFALQAAWKEDALHVTARQGKQASQEHQPLWLLLHVRGKVVHCAQTTPDALVSINKTSLPSGIVHILLLDKKMNPLSERLVFCLNDDQAKTVVAVDQSHFGTRAHIAAEVSVTDRYGAPMGGSYSLSVTDDRDVLPQKEVTITSVLLLASDLKGYIESPGTYFEEDHEKSADIDALLLTQGWRRYNIPAVAAGTLDRPNIPAEASHGITGTYRRANGGKVLGGELITLTSSQTGFYAEAVTDPRGKFAFDGMEQPDSTSCLLAPATAGAGVELVIDTPLYFKGYPFAAFSFSADAPVSGRRNYEYIQKSNAMYVSGNGLYTKQPSVAKVSDQAVTYDVTDIMTIIRKIAGIDILEDGTNAPAFFFNRTTTSFQIRNDDVDLVVNGRRAARVFVDNLMMDIGFDVRSLPITAIASVKADPRPTNQASGGSVIITTKTDSGDVPSGYSKTVIPLGYKRDVTFYSPKYETKESLLLPTPDLRTTLYWKPDNILVNGKSTFDFYAADSETTYSIVVEGITNDGKVIRQVRQIEIKKDSF